MRRRFLVRGQVDFFRRWDLSRTRANASLSHRFRTLCGRGAKPLTQVGAPTLAASLFLRPGLETDLPCPTCRNNQFNFFFNRAGIFQRAHRLSLNVADQRQTNSSRRSTMLIELVLTIFAWRKGWGPIALLPLAIGVILGVLFSGIGNSVASVVMADVLIYASLITMISVGHKKPATTAMSIAPVPMQEASHQTEARLGPIAESRDASHKGRVSQLGLCTCALGMARSE
jgi:hypothetical protein